MFNYKKIIKSRRVREKILALLNWVPNSIMIPLQYWIHTGRKLNLKNPKRFTEKLQIYKLKYRNPAMLRCTDKFEVRKFVEEKGFKDILVPLIGIYNNTKEIDFENLPNEFVVKTTDGSGSNQILICRDKSNLDKVEFYTKLNDWLNIAKPKKTPGREWAYENEFPKRIIIEKLLKDTKKNDLFDYKFFCFYGEPKLIEVDYNRFAGHQRSIFNINWERLPFRMEFENDQNFILEKPVNLAEMLKIAKNLSQDLPFARVDLYNVEEKIYFGEVTFYPDSGYADFTPDEWDEKLGNLLTLPGQNREIKC